MGIFLSPNACVATGGLSSCTNFTRYARNVKPFSAFCVDPRDAPICCDKHRQICEANVHLCVLELFGHAIYDEIQTLAYLCDSYVPGLAKVGIEDTRGQL